MLSSKSLIFVVLWSLVGGYPAGRQENQHDLLTGSDFLAVFMRSRRLHDPDNHHGYYSQNDLFNRDNAGGAYEHDDDFKLADIEFDKEYPTREEVEESTTPLDISTTTDGEPGTSTTLLDEEVTTEKPVQVVSVRVSSSVVRSRPVLTTEDQPTLTAVQRSHFGVDEASRSVSYSPPEPAEERKVVTYSEEHTVYRVEGRQGKYQRLPEQRVADSIAEASQNYRSQAEVVQEGKEDVKDVNKAPVSYQTSVSSATSGSRVQFYREFRPETSTPTSTEKEDEKVSAHPKNFEVSERVYGRPEENYEVDEAVSVQSNGRAHGVQTDSSDDKKDEGPNNHKFGYVVEGRNFRKYRVEERTPDGFIVGEYGVVSHDDGSLRGVRYTADSTINPRLIYDALLKFLSLK